MDPKLKFATPSTTGSAIENLETIVSSLPDAQTPHVRAALRLMRGRRFQIMTADEAKNKLPKVRRISQSDGIGTLIARRGKVSSSDKTEMVISLEDFMDVLGDVYQGGIEEGRDDEPLSTVTERFLPVQRLKSADAPVKMSVREYEETEGGLLEL